MTLLRQEQKLTIESHSNQPHATLGCALFIYMVWVTLLITLVPFRFGIPSEIKVGWSGNLNDIVTNILLFIPLGFLYRLSRRNHHGPFCLRELSLGVFLSLAIETFQLFVIGRYTSIIDVATNGMGAWLGAILFDRLKNKVSKPGVFRLFALQLPLMNLVYLLIPLLWLNGLATGNDSSRLFLLMLLGVFGSSVLAAVYAYRFADSETLSFQKFALIVLCWFYLSSAPALLNFPIAVLILGAALYMVVWVQLKFQKIKDSQDRRFELRVLRRLIPLYAIYLLFILMWPTTLPFHEWQLHANFHYYTQANKVVFIFRFIERIAAFTMLGYIISEMRGRRNESFLNTMVRILVISSAGAVCFLMLRGFPRFSISMLLEIIYLTAAGLYGGIIYRLQLTAILEIK